MSQRRTPSRRHFGPLGLILLGCSSIATPEPLPAPPHDQKAPANDTATPATQLRQALGQLAQSRYAEAEASLLALNSAVDAAVRERTSTGLAELWMLTGRRANALPLAQSYCRPDFAANVTACQIAAECLRRAGKIDEAILLLRPYAEQTQLRKLRLTLADLLAEKGLSSEATLAYRSLVADYNEAQGNLGNAEELAITARAAHRLGAFRNANELYNQAERSGIRSVETLLLRGELYLDAHDPKHAREVVDEALKYAPNHPGALVLFARVRLAESRDIAEAEVSARAALLVDAGNADAYFVLAGIALRDLHFHEVHRLIDQGLKAESHHLDLLSLRAAAHFLADETAAFQAATSAVLSLNPDYARLFRLVAEFAEAEHRYGDIIPLLRRAIALNASDAQAHAQLGIALVRSGDESEGRRELLRSYTLDPFDLRVRNTLVLFERSLDRDYSKVLYEPFELRVPKNVEAPLVQIVAPWLDSATKELARRYEPLEKGRLFLEVYSDQDSFGVRTTGAPANFLQGICFGRTIVIRLPTDEPVNVGMTLFHELSHVYHLQLSKHRVPRWFTEGLAEVETSRKREEWSREQDLRLYDAYRANKLPNLLDMNQAFSHAGSLNDLAVAYVASTYLVQYLVDTFGFAKMPKMLRAWGKGLPTEQVISSVLQTNVATLDTGFRAALANRFSLIRSQYNPPFVTAGTDAPTRFAGNTASPSATYNSVQVHLAKGELRAARQALELAPQNERSSADLLWVDSLLLAAENNAGKALEPLERLIREGHDGYFVRSQQALLYRLLADKPNEGKSLALANRFLPNASEPLYRLMALAREDKDLKAELSHVAALCRLEETDTTLHQRHVELCLDLAQPRAAQVAADALAFVDPLNYKSHELIALAARANGATARAKVEFRLAQTLAPDQTEQQRLQALERLDGRGKSAHPPRPTAVPAERDFTD